LQSRGGFDAYGGSGESDSDSGNPGRYFDRHPGV
jgi:hypothetical protein